MALEIVAGTKAKFQWVQMRKKVRKHEHQCRKFGVKAMKAVAAWEEGWRKRAFF